MIALIDFAFLITTNLLVGGTVASYLKRKHKAHIRDIEQRYEHAIDVERASADSWKDNYFELIHKLQYVSDKEIPENLKWLFKHAQENK